MVVRKRRREGERQGNRSAKNPGELDVSVTGFFFHLMHGSSCFASSFPFLKTYFSFALHQSAEADALDKSLTPAGFTRRGFAVELPSPKQMVWWTALCFLSTFFSYTDSDIQSTAAKKIKNSTMLILSFSLL